MKTILRLIPMVVLLAAACDDDAPIAPRVPSMLDEVRNTLAPYQDLAFALEAGYQAVSECIEDPILGGMGVNYGRADLIFSRGVEALRPEILVYEPMGDGTQRLVAIQFFVPFRVWGSDDPPVVLGQQLARNEEFQAYTLHAWLWKDNPSGIFADWNPDVTCTHAGLITAAEPALPAHGR